jgi:O-antigen/teichoic acid export membrane protein
MTSFNMTLQPGYGEAMGRNEAHWVASTIRSILHTGLIFIGILSAGFIVLTQPVVHLWTGGRIEIPSRMVAGVLLIAVTGALLNIFRFALTGMNRHRIAAMSELANGGLSFLAASMVVHFMGFAWVGFAVFAAALATSYWILPLELRRNLRVKSIYPPLPFWLRWIVCVAFAVLVGELGFKFLTPLLPIVSIGMTAVLITAAYAVPMWILLRDEWRNVSGLLGMLKVPLPLGAATKS